MSRGAQIKKEDIELYQFFFSSENLNSKAVSCRLRNILKYRFEDKMTYTAIAELMNTSALKIRTEIRVFKRRALIAKWYSEKVKNKTI